VPDGHIFARYNVRKGKPVSPGNGRQP
jgi:hypothetical protein